MSRTIPTIDRGETVDKLKELLYAHLYTTLDMIPENGVYDYIPGSTQGLTPLVAVMPRGSNRLPETPRIETARFRVLVFLYSLYQSKTADVSGSSARQTLDALERETAVCLAANTNVAGYWSDIQWEDFSEVDVLTIDNSGYLVEVIPLMVYALT